MDFSSIIGFIVIIVVTSLINKSKQQGQQQRTNKPHQSMNRHSNSRETMQQTLDREAGQKSTTFAKPQQRNKARGPNGLEDILREMQSDIKGVFGDFKGNAAPKAPVKEANIDEPQIEDERETNSWDTSNYLYDELDNGFKESEYSELPSDNKKNIEIPEAIEEIYAPKTQLVLNLTKSGLMQSIIMADILDKPKSLRRQR